MIQEPGAIECIRGGHPAGRLNWNGGSAPGHVSRIRLRTEQSSYRRSFEEYRYDALGRRVWVRARRECDDGSFAALCELSWVRRTVWDGDRELYEIQAPGAETLADSVHMENDAGHLNLGMRTAEPPDGKALDPNPFYGRVAYTYGLGIDQPLSLVRTGYGDRADAGGNDTGLYRALSAFAVIPLWNHRGQAVLGVFGDGKWRRCETQNRCIFIGWPELWAGYARPRIQPTFWHGSLISDKQDGSGLHYRRNRYYDPATGRFTQEDPIGLSGGLNVYAFGAGDPVSYSDPFGLCPYSGTIRTETLSDCPTETEADRKLLRAYELVQRYAPRISEEVIARSLTINPFEGSMQCRGGPVANGCADLANGALWVNVNRSAGAAAETIVHETFHFLNWAVAVRHQKNITGTWLYDERSATAVGWNFYLRLPRHLRTDARLNYWTRRYQTEGLGALQALCEALNRTDCE